MERHARNTARPGVGLRNIEKSNEKKNYMTQNTILNVIDLPSLDIETSPRNGAPSEYALQPWRVKEGTAGIDNIAVGKASGEALLVTKPSQFRALLRSLEGMTISGFNLTFDLSFLIASGYAEEVKKITWIDAMLAWKWLDNSQLCERRPAWSLSDAAVRFFKDESWAKAFVTMKKQDVAAGADDNYWETRAKADAIITARVLAAAWLKLDDQRRASSLITMSSLVPVADSYQRGLLIDYALIDDILPVVTSEMAEIEYRLGIHNAQYDDSKIQLGTNGWTPSKVLRSSKQLADLLYNVWDLTAKTFSEKTGEPSTNKAALTYLADDNDQVLEILRWRELNTQLSKYLQSPLKAREYLGKDVVHPQAKIFSTYTGRMTYTSKIQRKFPTGVALHQWPRKKEFRALIRPRPGYKHVELDAAGQESRLMAEHSRDANMMQVFVDGMDFHSYTGAKVSGMSYDDFMKGKKEKNTAITGDHGYRYQGKFTNLSNNYRIGVKKLRVQARVQYGMNVNFQTALGWQIAFFNAFPDVKKYWRAAISRAKMQKCAYTLAGRRFKLIYWDKDSQWATESSAINFPIQGTGADMKDLAIQEIDKYFPEFEFWFDLHDGLHYEVPQHVTNERIIECREMLNKLDYKKWWGYAPVVPLTWDASVGARWSELEEL